MCAKPKVRFACDGSALCINLVNQEQNALPIIHIVVFFYFRNLGSGVQCMSTLHGRFTIINKKLRQVQINCSFSRYAIYLVLNSYLNYNHFSIPVLQKQMQIEPHKLDFGFKPDFFNRSSGSSFMGLQPRDLPRPYTILSNAGRNISTQVTVILPSRMFLDHHLVDSGTTSLSTN